MLQGRAMTKESYTTMVVLQVISCLLLLTLSCFHANADPLQEDDVRSALHQAGATACFAALVGRGAGAPLNRCPEGMEQSGALCYTPCRDSYHGVGPVCLRSCSPGFKDTGALCIHSYGKGCCCTIFGCCGRCPAGYHDDGCFCRQSYSKSYGRGVGVPLGCGPGKERDGALCYEPCSDGFSGEGPVCWQNQGSTVGFPIKCNRVVWAVDEETCRKVRAEFSAARVASESCLGVALAATAVPSLEPLAVGVCSNSIGEATAAADKLVHMTGARTCPRH